MVKTAPLVEKVHIGGAYAGESETVPIIVSTKIESTVIPMNLNL
jgi:hypothetical protein